MLTIRQVFIMAVAAFSLLPFTTRSVLALDPQQATQLAEEAYIYGLGPMVYYRLYKEQLHEGDWETNRIVHRRKLADYRERGGQAPNHDTVYSAGWLDVGDEPLVMQLPDFQDRFYAIQLTDFYQNNFQNIGNSMGYGMKDEYKKAYTFLLAGPGWAGEAPDDLPVVKATGNIVHLLIRIFTDGSDPDDTQRVNALQDQILIVPLSARVAGSKEPVAKEPGIPAAGENTELDYFVALNTLMSAEPPNADNEKEYIKRFEAINVGPGQTFDPATLDPAMRDALLAGIESAKEKVKEEQTEGSGSVINGWNFSSEEEGAYGDNYLLRAASVELGGIIPRPQFNMYASTFNDAQGELLDSANKYVIRFEKDQFPPVTTFWSVTIYGSDFWLHQNEIDRYNLSNRTPGIQYNDDGSLEMYIQHERPADDKVSNWLPAPEGGFFFLMRFYAPEEPVRKHEYVPPAVQRVEG